MCMASACDAFIHYAKENYSGAFACHRKAEEALPALGWIPRLNPWMLEYLGALEAQGFFCEKIDFRTALERAIDGKDLLMKGAALRYRAMGNLEKKNASAE